MDVGMSVAARRVCEAVGVRGNTPEVGITGRIGGTLFRRSRGKS